MFEFWWSLFAFVIAITILIGIHEFGHFWVARRCGVKVTRFSIGFGRPIWRRYGRDGTEYVIAILPIGGYVKMLDEREGKVGEHELSQAFNRQSVWARIAIVGAGPLFNFLFAVVAYWWMFAIGINYVAPVIGQVLPNSVAAQAGLRPGQEIVAINGQTTTSWRAVNIKLVSHLGQSSKITVGLRNLNDKAWQEVKLDLAKWQFDAKLHNPLSSLGIIPYIPPRPTLIGRVMPDSPAAKAGLRSGDKVLKIGGVTVNNWRDLDQQILQHPGQRLTMEVSRQGKLLNFTVMPGRREGAQADKEVGYLGIYSMPIVWPDWMIRSQRYPVATAWWPALRQTWQMTGLTFQLLAKMVTGSLSVHNISGPIGIARGAGMMASIGIAYYLSFLALVSISLGILNILPIPILDGGHLFYYLIELIRRRPVSEKFQIIAFRVGIIILFGLMALAFYNDLLRLFANTSG